MATAYGMSEDDKREIIADFLSESEQHVQTLNTHLIKAEELLKISQPISDEAINLMFRAAHTIKGSASMLGFENLSHLTHEMEAVLDRVRNKVVPLSAAMIEALFTAFDSLNSILDKLRKEGNDQLDIKEVVNKIKATLTPSEQTQTHVQTKEDKVLEASDMSKYIPAFLEDTEGCVLRFNEILLGWEKDRFTPEQLDELFRFAHTIKGSSGIIKCKGIESVAHRMEDLLSFFRTQKTKPTADTTALLFKGIDWIKNTMETLRKGDYQEAQLPAFLHQFEESKSRPMDPFSVLSEEVKNKICIAQEANNNIFKIIILLQSKAMKDVKALIIDQRLKKTGTVLDSIPGLENIQDNDTIIKVHILYATPGNADQVRLFLSLDDVDIISINKENYSYLMPAVETPVKIPSEASAPAAKLSTHAKTGSLEMTTMKVDSRKLDHLMNLSGELVITRARFAQLINEFDTSMTPKEIAAKVYSLSEVTASLGKISSDIQSAVMQARMVPIEGVFSRFRRLVRDISKDQHKEINLEFSGEDTELDKKIVDALPDSLTHMIRNAIDHGIENPQERLAAGKKETGTIQLKAIHQGNSIYIEINDDGRGLDSSKLGQKALEKNLVNPEKLARMSEKEKLNFIFLPGFSTVEKVTGISGRGVGMDVVKKMIESLSGTIDIETKVGLGTSIILKIPLTLAIIQALLVTIKDQIYAIPLEDVSEVIKIRPQDVYSVDGMPIIKLRGHALNLLSLSNILGISQEHGINAECKVVVVSINEELFGIKVDSLIGEDEIVIKSFPDYFAHVKGISGASILGDGSIALIMDAGTILQGV